MIRFRFASIPVHVHFSHLLISGFIASTLVGFRTNTEWPRLIIGNTSHPRHTQTVVLVTAVWMLLITVSVLLHSLGKAFMIRAFGGKAQVHLLGLGGRTVMERLSPLEWWQEVMVSLAGPGAALAIAVASGLIALGGGLLPDPLAYFSRGLFFANLSWTVVSLLPMTGLDGGVITTTVFTRLFGRNGFLFAQLIALGLAALVVGWSLLSGQPILAVLMALLVVRTFANVFAWQRGELPLETKPDPLLGVMERAEALYRERKLGEAQFLASGVLDAPMSAPLLRSRAHVLLGWIALKQGEGRRALDHFSQVQGLEVPLHALAAGFSLVGDEFRAIPLWAQAAQRAPGDSVILHEWAGALIRGGQEASARAIPAVDLVRAFTAAERVHYVRKEFESAARAAEAAFNEAKHPALAYTAACALAQAGKPEDAMRLLSLAAESGYRNATEAEEDPDLRPLRHRTDFANWLKALKS